MKISVHKETFISMISRRFIHNIPKLKKKFEKEQMCINKKLDKQIVVYSDK